MTPTTPTRSYGRSAVPTCALLAALILTAATAPPAAVAAPAAGKPNIVVILVDDMGFSDVGCYGGETRTPNLGSDDSRRPGFDRWLSFRGHGIYVDGVLNDDGRQVQLTWRPARCGRASATSGPTSRSTAPPGRRGGQRDAASLPSEPMGLVQPLGLESSS